MTILGIDIGTATTGWAVIEAKGQPKDQPKSQTRNPKSAAANSFAPKLIGCGTIDTHKLAPEPERLVELGESFTELLDEFKPTEIAIEQLFFSKNVTTAMKVSQARGVLVYLATQRELPTTGYNPVQVKKALTGYGRATKSQMLTMVDKLFSLSGQLTQDDAADAVAIAYCHYLSLEFA